MWRRITDDGVSAAFGLAADEFMANRADGPVAVRLYTYASHCVLIGRHQNLASEVNPEACAEEGAALCRRPTGGGTILMGADQLGVALTIPASKRKDFPASGRELYPVLAGGVIEGLARFGIEARFHRKNDLEAGGKKIAGLGVYMAPGGGLLFHASVLVDLDVALMLRLLRTPFEKLSDKAASTVAERITTVRREGSPPPGVGAVREAVAEGYARRLGEGYFEEPWSAAERAGIESLASSKYATDEWISPPGVDVSRMGSARKKTPGGLLEVHLQVAKGRIAQCVVTGDFFAAEARVRGLERSMRGAPASAEGIDNALGEYFRERGAPIEGVTGRALCGVFQRAVRDAARGNGRPASYACFVNP